MARFAAILGLVVVALGALHWWRPFLTEQRVVFASTPSPGPRATGIAIPLKPHSRLCVAPVTLDPTVARARFTLAAARPGPARIEVQARAPGYGSDTSLEPSLQRTAMPVAIPIRRPGRAATGTLCIRNAGSSRLLFTGTNDRLSIGAAQTSVDGKKLDGEAIELELLEARTQSVLGRLGTIVHRAADLTGNLMPFWLAWMVVVALVMGTPIAVFAGFWATLRSGEAD